MYVAGEHRKKAIAMTTTMTMCDWTVLHQFNVSAQQQLQQQQQQQRQQQQQFGLQQQHRLARLLVKIIKANGLADGDFGLYMNVLFIVFTCSVVFSTADISDNTTFL